MKSSGIAALVAILLLAAIGRAGAAELYKWVDEQGHVYYSDRKPPDRPCEKVTTPECPSPEQQEHAQKQLEKQKELLKTYEKARRTEQAKEQVQKVERELQQLRCQEARRQLRFLMEAEGARLGVPGPEGEMRWISDAERQRMREHWTAEVKQWCD